MTLSDRCLIAFDNWFASKAGVYHTFALTAIIVLAEALFPGADPHGFWLLYWLTVYSAVTQPALAHTGRESAQRIERLLSLMEQLMEREEAEIAQLITDKEQQISALIKEKQ